MKEQMGRVLRIEKTSIHDGEGLRTVVFLKGCPLRCHWCSTPESQKMETEQGYGCDMTPEEVIREICKDEIFFFHSGGGVTISGGEVLLQADFAREILAGCRERGIETAVETSLFADFAEIEKLLPVLDAMYIDFKVYDDEAHRFYTGVSNGRVKENIIRTTEAFKGKIHIRIPVIPTVNLTVENMKNTGEFLAKLGGVQDVELLPYHKLGLETYRKLNRVYTLKGIETPAQEEMRTMAQVLRETALGCPVKIKGELVE